MRKVTKLETGFPGSPIKNEFFIFPKAKGRLGEYLALLALLKVQENFANAPQVSRAQLAILLAQILAQRLHPPLH